ncbi:MAG: TonB family protein [Candidatus Acidiferrales bacterium]
MPEFPDITQNLHEHADRRAHSRHRIRALAYVELGENNGGIVLNISEGGFAVRAAEAIREDSLSRLRFQMQNATQPLEMSGDIAWTSVSRKEAGVRFMNLREEALLEIRTWILKEVGTLPKQPPIVPSVLSNLDEFSGDEVAETEIQGNDDDLVSGSSVIPDSKIRFSDSRVPKTPVEEQRYGATLFPKEAVAAPSARPSVVALPAIKKPNQVQPLPREQKAPENWMDFRIQMGRGWVLAALVTFLVAISFAGGMAVRRGDLIGLWRNSATTQSTGAQTQVSVPAAPSAQAPPKPLQIEIVDSSNQRWVIPASAGAVRSGTNGGGIASTGTLHDSSENIDAPSFGSSRTLEHQGAEKASTVPGEKGTAPLLLSLPERSVSASGSVAISSQRSFAVPAESSQAASQSGKNLQVGQLVNLVDPVYPPDAEQKHIEGTVKLHATIGADGSIKDLQPLSGPPSLLPAALTAVREWRYNPTLLNGQPIETQEDISLVFRLPN